MNEGIGFCAFFDDYRRLLDDEWCQSSQHTFCFLKLARISTVPSELSRHKLNMLKTTFKTFKITKHLRRTFLCSAIKIQSNIKTLKLFSEAKCRPHVDNFIRQTLICERTMPIKFSLPVLISRFALCFDRYSLVEQIGAFCTARLLIRVNHALSSTDFLCFANFLSQIWWNNHQIELDKRFLSLFLSSFSRQTRRTWRPNMNT